MYNLYIWSCNFCLFLWMSDHNSGTLNRFASNFEWGPFRTTGMVLPKKYVDQKPPYLIHQLCRSGDNKIYFYRRHDWIMIKKRKNICYLRVYALKAGERNDNIQDCIQIVKLYMVKLGCLNKSKNKFSFHWNQCRKGQ